MRQRTAVKIRCRDCNTLEGWRLSVKNSPTDNRVEMDCGHQTDLTDAIDQIQMMTGNYAIHRDI